MNNQTILFVIHRLGYGGAEKILSFLANGLAKQGYKIHVYTYEDVVQHYTLNDDVAHITEQKIPSIKGFRRIIQIFQIRRMIKNINPNVVISFLNYPNLLSILATLFTKTPIIISERGDPYQGNGLVDKFRKFMFRFANGAVFQTEGARNYFCKKMSDKSCIIPNPVTRKGIFELVLKRTNEIAYVGRFELVQKRQDLMLLAFRKVVDVYPDIKLVFYGDGPDEQKVEKMVEQLNLSDNVRFAGLVNNVCEKIRTSRLFVLTSDYEGVPNALIEAMSVGLPVIATDCSPGGANMLIEDKKNGLIVPKGDVDAIANAIKYLIENEQIAEEYGYNATKILEKFTPEKSYGMWAEYINKVIGQKYAR